MNFKKIPLTASLCLVAMAACLSSGRALAQTVTGSVTGEVTDTTGAVIPKATVVAENVDTGVKTTTTTNGTGVYTIRFLPIGKYKVSVDAQGFSRQTFSVFSLEIDQSVKLNALLTVGATTSVEVDSSEAAILNTTDATLGTTFTANTIANLPLNGLDFSAVTLYLPGSVDTGGTSGTTSIERSTYWTDTPNMNGNRAQANNYTLDGIDMNETFNNLIAYSPAPESLQEVRVLTANSPADFGNVNGGGVVSVLKSGTNKFHGSAYAYDQNQKFNANSFANNNSGNPKGSFSQAQFGGTLGGPILKGKLFFFVDYLGSRFHNGGSTTASVLTQAMRNGDFSVLLQQPTPIQLYDSENNFAPYVGNLNVPILNPVAKFLVANPQFYPLPNATPTDGIAANNLIGSFRHYEANNQGDVKLEYAPGTKDRVTAFYAMSTGYDGQTSLLAITFPGTNLFPTKIAGSNWVHTFSPAIINSARLGFTRVTWNQGLPGDPSGQFGLGGDAKVGIPFGVQKYVGFANQGIGSGFSSVGTPAFDGGFTDNTYSYIDNLTWQRGKHLLSMGVEAIRYQNNYPTSNNDGFLGTLNYSGNFTSNPNPNVTNGPGYSAADFVLDRVSAANVTLNSINVGQRQWRDAGFFEDDFKATSKLTLNFGIRYEYDEPWIEQNNKTGNVDLATGQPIYAGSVPTGAPAGSGVCKNLGCYQPNYHQIMPRLGFAYQVNTRLVVRGGYGATSFYEGNSSNQRLTGAPPFLQAVNIQTQSPTVTSGGTPRTVEDGFSFTDPNDLSLSGSFSTYPQNIQPAYVQEFNLTTEYALTNTLSLQVGYIGESGQHIEDYGNVNQWKVPNDPTSAPYYSNPNFGSGGLLVTESRAMMNFNALESTLRQRLHNGLEFTLNYTYSKAMTNSLGNYSLDVNGYSGAFQNYYDSAADYGPAGYDVTHNISGTGVYALPFGSGKEFLKGANRMVDEIVGGWKLSTAGVYYSGFPETLTGGGSNTNSYGNERANEYFPLRIVNRSKEHWFGTDPSATPCTTAGAAINALGAACAYGVPASNTFGTSRNGAVRGPGYLNVDLSAFKEFRTYKDQAFSFRFDAFNAFNIVSYGNPDTGIQDTGFGQIVQQNSIRSTERRMQFSLKYAF
ncbi:MAG TPA: TonB-dependent receptor [Acidobacteriaceae bacterium]